MTRLHQSLQLPSTSELLAYSQSDLIPVVLPVVMLCECGHSCPLVAEVVVMCLCAFVLNVPTHLAHLHVNNHSDILLADAPIKAVFSYVPASCFWLVN